MQNGRCKMADAIWQMQNGRCNIEDVRYNKKKIIEKGYKLFFLKSIEFSLSYLCALCVSVVDFSPFLMPV
jgi:hypothetical protein